MNEVIFWNMIEDAWQSVGGKAKERLKLSKGSLSEKQSNSLMDALEEVTSALRESVGFLTQEDLLGFDRILERKLYDIDRADIQEITDGSDDGFLYARGFIVACGKGYYDAVNTEPSVAMPDLDCEDMCYLSWHVYSEKFGDMPRSEISRESCSNKAGWPET